MKLQKHVLMQFRWCWYTLKIFEWTVYLWTVLFRISQ